MVGHLKDPSREDSKRLNFRKWEQNFFYDRLVNLLNHLLVAVNPGRENLAEDGLEADRLVRMYEKVRRAYYNVVKLNGGGPHGPNVLIQKMKEKLNPENQTGPPQWQQFQRVEEETLRQLLLSIQIHLHKATDPQGNNYEKGSEVGLRLMRTYEKLSALYYNVVELNGGAPDDAATQIRKHIRLKVTGDEPKRRSLQDLEDQGLQL